LDQGMTPDDRLYGKEPGEAAGRLYSGGAGNTEVREVVSPRGDYPDFYARVYESIVDDKPEPVTADDGIRVMQIIDAAFESHRERKVVEVSPQP